MANHPNSPSACFYSLAKSNSRSQVIFPLSQAVLFIAVIAGKPLSMAALHRRFLQVTWKPSLPFRNSKANNNLTGETDTAGSASLRKSDLKFGRKEKNCSIACCFSSASTTTLSNPQPLFVLLVSKLQMCGPVALSLYLDWGYITSSKPCNDWPLKV